MFSDKGTKLQSGKEFLEGHPPAPPSKGDSVGKSIDREKVYWMLRTGWHPERIAERLNASRRQVDRIRKANGWGGSFALVSFEDEHELWEFYRNVFDENDRKIGLRFGRSKQAVHKYFNDRATKRQSDKGDKKEFKTAI